MEMIIKFVLDLAVQNPQIAAIVFIIGGARVVFKPLVSAAQAIVGATESKKDDEIYGQIVSHPIFKAFEFALDYIFSIKKIK